MAGQAWRSPRPMAGVPFQRRERAPLRLPAGLTWQVPGSCRNRQAGGQCARRGASGRVRGPEDGPPSPRCSKRPRRSLAPVRSTWTLAQVFPVSMAMDSGLYSSRGFLRFKELHTDSKEKGWLNSSSTRSMAHPAPPGLSHQKKGRAAHLPMQMCGPHGLQSDPPLTGGSHFSIYPSAHPVNQAVGHSISRRGLPY